MKQRDAFALGQAKLLADIGIERSGMPMRVISALRRQRFDPWLDAGRLAKLPRNATSPGPTLLPLKRSPHRATSSG